MLHLIRWRGDNKGEAGGWGGIGKDELEWHKGGGAVKLPGG